MAITRINPDVSGIIKAVNYAEARSNASGNRSYTHPIPSGYELLVPRPVGAFASGNASAYITDRVTSVSGSNVTATLYVYNPQAAGVTVAYTLIYVKSGFA